LALAQSEKKIFEKPQERGEKPVQRQEKAKVPEPREEAYPSTDAERNSFPPNLRLLLDYRSPGLHF